MLWGSPLIQLRNERVQQTHQSAIREEHLAHGVQEVAGMLLSNRMEDQVAQWWLDSRDKR